MNEIDRSCYWSQSGQTHQAFDTVNTFPGQINGWYWSFLLDWLQYENFFRQLIMCCVSSNWVWMWELYLTGDTTDNSPDWWSTDHVFLIRLCVQHLPRYNHQGWLDIKYQVTSAQHAVTALPWEYTHPFPTLCVRKACACTFIFVVFP